ncbi:ribonuclease H2 subunit C [Grus americana]|uniref:ribonuclease H2 subunit C n=1 Tax=Grus americana TaxID=9117 RepID=UPI002407CA01|nr:ribonuclease H2 subunit C [Grus americana]
MAGPWGRLVAALGPPGDRDPPPLRALRRPRPAPRHQTELLLLLLESPRELCGGGSSVGGSPEWGDSVGEVGGALLTLLTLPPAPPPAPPRSLLLLATLTFLLATGDVGGAAVFGALLVEGGVTGGAPATVAECLRELRRMRIPGTPPRNLGPLWRCQRETPGILPLTLLLAEEGRDPADPHDEAGTDPELWASFRGRRLGGRELPLPPGYRGVLLREGEPPPGDEGDPQDQWVKVMGTFDVITEWGADAVPSPTAGVALALQWGPLACAIHAPVSDDSDEEAEP